MKHASCCVSAASCSYVSESFRGYRFVPRQARPDSKGIPTTACLARQWPGQIITTPADTLSIRGRGQARGYTSNSNSMHGVTPQKRGALSKKCLKYVIEF